MALKHCPECNGTAIMGSGVDGKPPTTWWCFKCKVWFPKKGA